MHIVMEFYKQLFLSNRLYHPDRRGHIFPHVDQVIVYDSEAQTLPRYPLAEIQGGNQNDGFFFAFRSGSQLTRFLCPSLLFAEKSYYSKAD